MAGMIFAKDGLVVRRLTAADASLLVKWLSDPRVLEYYGGRDRPHDVNMVLEYFFDDNDEETRCIVTYNGVDIGYVQLYRISDEEYEDYGYSKEEVVYGMDQFIGEVEYWNQGIGTQLIRGIVEHIVSLDVRIIVMDPQTWNHRALRCYEKCGFRTVKLLPEHEWHEGVKRDCWLIVYKSNN